MEAKTARMLKAQRNKQISWAITRIVMVFLTVTTLLYLLIDKWFLIEMVPIIAVLEITIITGEFTNIMRAINKYREGIKELGDGTTRTDEYAYKGSRP